MADIFISYAAVDRQRVHLLVAEFEAKGYSVWWDPRIGIGSSFDREIERELDVAKCVVVVWSESAVESEWVRAESQEGLDRGILVPVRIDDAKPPLAFRRAQTADLSDAGFHPSTMGSVLDAIAQAVDKTHHSAYMQTISSPASITGRAPSDATDINQTSSKTKRRVLQTTLVTCLLGALGVTGAWWFANRTTPSSVVLPSISDTGESPSLGGRNPLADARFSKITDYRGSEFHAAISPDGQFVVFVSDRDGPFEVFLSQIDTGGVSDVSSRKEEFQLAEDTRSPVRIVGFSGDGTEIWYRSMSDLAQLRAMPLLGGAVHTLLGEKAVTPAWSPDGQYIAYHERLPGDPIHVVDQDGSMSQMILEASTGMHQHFPTWSVDSQWLYLVRGRPSLDMSLWRVRPDGSEAERLTWAQLDVRFPAPINERTVIYSALDSDGAGPWLWAVDVETKISVRASLGLEQYSSVAASANGHRLVATLQTPRAELWSVPILDRVATESDAQTLPEVPADRAFAPRLRGEWLFYLASRGGGDGLWRLRNGKSEEIWRGSVTPLSEPAAVSPDGGSVALILRRDNRRRVHVLSSDGATRKALTEKVDARGAPEWSPDGQWIVVGGIQDGVSGLYKLPVAGGASQLIVGGEALNPVWSPTGDLIVFAGAEVGPTATLRAVRPDGVSVEIPEILVLHNGERMRFLPDGSGLVYMKGLRSVQDFWLLDIDTMKDRQLTQLDAGATMRTFDITPDASKIVFDRLIEDSDIVLIERDIKD